MAVNTTKSKKEIVCKELKGLLAKNDLTIGKLAGKLGISENALTLKINGERRLWLDEALKITKIFGFEQVRDVFPELYDASK